MSDEVTRLLSCGEVLVEMLTKFGVEIIFGLPGDQTDIYDALYRRPEIRHVLVRHEHAAAHMADAYARATTRVGICDAAVGPGATNLISGISEAFTSGIPVIAIVSDIRDDWRGRGSFQEIDQVGVFRPITKKTITVDCVARIPELVRRAFQIATTDRPGPVLLNLPLNVLKGEHRFAESDLRVDRRYGRFPANRFAPATRDIAAACDALMAARRPVILAGGGVIASDASGEVREISELLDIPVATTFMGKGTLAEDHPLSLGPFGSIGRPTANNYVLKADLALALGTRLTNVDTAGWQLPGKETSIVQVDIDPAQIGRNRFADLALPGDIKTVLLEILSVLRRRCRKHAPPVRRNEVAATTATWRRERGIDSIVASGDDTSPVHPLQVIRALQRSMNPDDVLICDSGFNQVWGGQFFEVRKPGRNYMGPRGFGVMGFSLPAAIAHALAFPDRRAVALCGDGGFAMVIQELETAVRCGAPVTVCVMNNSCLQFIRDNQRLLFDNRYISTAFGELDFAGIAQAFGCTGMRVKKSGDLENALSQALENKGPTVIDILSACPKTP